MTEKGKPECYGKMFDPTDENCVGGQNLTVCPLADDCRKLSGERGKVRMVTGISPSYEVYPSEDGKYRVDCHFSIIFNGTSEDLDKQLEEKMEMVRFQCMRGVEKIDEEVEYRKKMGMNEESQAEPITVKILARM